MLNKYIDAELEAKQSTDEPVLARLVVSVEDSVQRTFEVNTGGLPIPLTLRGKIDRADTVAGVLHVIDYKTGKVGVDKNKMKGELDQLFVKKDYSKLLQLLIYIMMTREKNQAVPVASFYSMRENGGSFVFAQELTELTIDHDFIDKAEEALGRFLNELLERDTFEHNPSSLYCEYCMVSH
jgi:RecB family exonuclease